MVNALEKIHLLLEPGGFLLDIHPSGKPPPIEVRVGDRVYLAGWLTEDDEYLEYIHADEALQVVATRGLFAVEKKGTFSFNTYAGSLEDLIAYLKEVWEDAILEDKVAGRIEDLWRSPSNDKELIIRETIKISRLRPL
jgi:hypothetical protein